LTVTAPKAAQPAGDGGIISGFVYEAGGMTAIADTQVCVEDYDTGDGLGCASTSGDGRYEAGGLPKPRGFRPQGMSIQTILRR